MKARSGAWLGTLTIAPPLAAPAVCVGSEAGGACDHGASTADAGTDEKELPRDAQ